MTINFYSNFLNYIKHQIFCNFFKAFCIQKMEVEILVCKFLVLRNSISIFRERHMSNNPLKLLTQKHSCYLFKKYIVSYSIFLQNPHTHTIVQLIFKIKYIHCNECTIWHLCLLRPREHLNIHNRIKITTKLFVQL